ncbi:MAG: SGNH/GDSL hydrolase family protein [Chloroflexota bacterium]|nr:SGNH/GDSL hydrolase family protein [Chloroflexota bacterium]
MKAFRNYLVTSILLLGLLSFFIPIRYQTSYPAAIGPKFDSRVRTTYTDMLNEYQPQVLLFGDSMLEPAVDERAVAEALDKKTALVSLPGTASTIWYLMLKNNIVLAEHKPQYLVLFFRDAMMTVPGYRVTGRYFEQIDEFASPEDTLLIQRAYIDQMTPVEKFMEAYVPLYSARWEIRQSIDYHIRYTLGRLLLGCDPACMDYAMEAVFEANNLDVTFLSEAIASSDEYFYTPERLDFQAQVEKSFLPEVIRLCRENGIQLILVRMPILSFEEPGTQPEGLDAYVQDLAVYLQESDVPFLDFDNEEFTGDYFTDSLHLNERGKTIFTQKLVDVLLAEIE